MRFCVGAQAMLRLDDHAIEMAAYGADEPPLIVQTGMTMAVSTPPRRTAPRFE
jgi:hypothetical protein